MLFIAFSIANTSPPLQDTLRDTLHNALPDTLHNFQRSSPCNRLSQRALEISRKVPLLPPHAANPRPLEPAR